MRDEFNDEKHWARRFLPHYDIAHKYQMITYRLADSLPQAIKGNSKESKHDAL